MGDPLQILVIGAAGFIGSHLAAHLADHGHAVVGLNNFNPHIEKARRLLGYEPRTPLAEGIARQLSWVEAHRSPTPAALA